MRRPFKMFFGIAIGIMVLLFVARIALVAFIAAAIMTAVYAVFRKLRDFSPYGRQDEAYYTRRHNGMGMGNYHSKGVEPLFHDYPAGRMPSNDTRYVEAF